ncbi:DUF2399 domain-containing protein [Sporosarcina ureilytica]|uniref:DUF2399 domain-containing protein n=1 Tax=Sporosarcina ureilytica TaxID=298596 RepID=A0A1D8JDM7_9BACL|nr:DUF2399 domain-containing protein [Sporosarcina ureilytica]AOV06803.1 hypothetical protein BI350_03855 [Sporosarcina ureilytica]
MLTTKAFLEQYICKVGESVAQINENEWEIQRWTARTFKTLGNVFATTQYEITPNDEVIKLNLQPNSRRNSLSLSESKKEESLEKGWLIQEVRFKKDGRTPLSTQYRMGPGLFIYYKLKAEEQVRADACLREMLHEEIGKSEKAYPTHFVKHLKQFMDEKSDNDSWGKERVRKFFHFLIAYLRLRRRQEHMEYKEIGATYYQKIGGSKEFDRYRDVFISRLEKWLGAPVQELGIISVGTIVPIYFSGHVLGKYSKYGVGTVHATTDIAVAEEDFCTDARIFWLVENRAVLTRMATEVPFLADTKSIILGVDGQIRGAHRKMIQQLCESGSIQKVMIWVDYDNAGDVIARDLVNLIGTIPFRIIGNKENLFTTYEAYVDWSQTVPHAEQEMTLGGEEQWRKWISL